MGKYCMHTFLTTIILYKLLRFIANSILGFIYIFWFFSGFEASLTFIHVYTCQEHNKRNTGFYFLQSPSPEYLHFAHKFLRADSLRLCSNQGHTSWHGTACLPFPIWIYCHFPSSAQSRSETQPCWWKLLRTSLWRTCLIPEASLCLKRKDGLQQIDKTEGPWLLSFRFKKDFHMVKIDENYTQSIFRQEFQSLMLRCIHPVFSQTQTSSDVEE